MNTVEENYDRLVPMEQEQSVLGCLLRLNRSIDQIGDLSEEDFFDGQHKTIYRAILQLVMANKPADVITVFGRLKDAGKDVEIGYLNMLQQGMPSAANIASYCGVVRDRALKRRMLALANDMIEEVYHSPEDGPALIDSAAARLEALGRVSAAGEPELAIDSLTHHIERLDAEYNGEKSPAVATGIT